MKKKSAWRNPVVPSLPTTNTPTANDQSKGVRNYLRELVSSKSSLAKVPCCLDKTTSA